MVGVCLTVIGLICVINYARNRDTLADDLLAADALLFLISCLLFYWALRSRGLRRMHRIEKIADGIFIIAMIGMVVICALITYTISVPAR
jgi:cytochrome c oxidase assembly factor CtaG